MAITTNSEEQRAPSSGDYCSVTGTLLQYATAEQRYVQCNPRGPNLADLNGATSATTVDHHSAKFWFYCPCPQKFPRSTSARHFTQPVVGWAGSLCPRRYLHAGVCTPDILMSSLSKSLPPQISNLHDGLVVQPARSDTLLTGNEQ
jgi:hypothetical protein